MNKFLTNLGQTFSDDEKAVIKNKLENILGTDQVKMAWYPTVANNGTISWGLSAYSTPTPTPMNIKGPQGEPGNNGVDGEPGTSVTITNIEEEGRTHVVIFSDGKSITITDGVDGAGVAIKGTVATKANLPADAENGDAYIVTSEDGKLFVYANGWPDEGVAFTGPKGERGETPSFSFIDGETGIEIHVNDSEDPVAVIPYAVDGHSPVITTSATSTGNDIYIDGTKAFSVTNGTNGTSGKDGYTPSATTATVTDAGHPNSGTKVTLSWPADASWLSPVSFTAWNGNDGITPDNVVTSGTAQAEEKPWVLSAGEWVNATSLVSMYKTSNTANIKPVTQVLYNYHTYDEDRYNYIEVTDSSNKVWSAHTLIHPMYDSIKFAENGLLTGTCESGVWTLSAKEQGGGDYLPLTGGTVLGDFKVTKNNCTTFFNVDDANHARLEFTNAENATHRFVFGPGTNPYLYTSVSNQNQYFVMALTSTAGNVEKLQIHSNTEDPTTFADNVIHFVLE